MNILIIVINDLFRHRIKQTIFSKLFSINWPLCTVYLKKKLRIQFFEQMPNVSHPSHDFSCITFLVFRLIYRVLRAWVSLKWRLNRLYHRRFHHKMTCYVLLWKIFKINMFSRFLEIILNPTHTIRYNHIVIWILQGITQTCCCYPQLHVYISYRSCHS